MYIVSTIIANDCVTQHYVGLDLLKLNSYLPPWFQIPIINIDTDQKTVYDPKLQQWYQFLIY